MKKTDLTMTQDEFGCWHETEASIKRRIQAEVGFESFEIELMESYDEHGICKHASFVYLEHGWWINFETHTIARDEAYDVKSILK